MTYFDVKWNPHDRLDQPLRWRKPRRVFVNSMSDLFHDDVPDDFIAQVFAVMALAPHHTFQVLTKRPERMRDLLSDDDFWFSVEEYASDFAQRPVSIDSPLPNVWLGVSVEDQATADQRIPLLLETPAAVRFVSYEPALGNVNLMPYLMPNALNSRRRTYIDGVNWVIVGGESGPKARPFDVQWARDTIRQCRTTGVPVFVKQLGAKPFQSGSAFDVTDLPPSTLVRANSDATGWDLITRHRAGADMEEWPADIRVRQTPNTIQED